VPDADTQTWLPQCDGVPDGNTCPWKNSPTTSLPGAVSGGEHRCAKQGGTCSCSGTVVYGADVVMNVIGGDGATKDKPGISCSTLYTGGAKVWCARF
jgi:hypothetical protein